MSSIRNCHPNVIYAPQIYSYTMVHCTYMLHCLWHYIELVVTWWRPPGPVDSQNPHPEPHRIGAIWPPGNKLQGPASSDDYNNLSLLQITSSSKSADVVYLRHPAYLDWCWSKLNKLHKELSSKCYLSFFLENQMWMLIKIKWTP